MPSLARIIALLTTAASITTVVAHPTSHASSLSLPQPVPEAEPGPSLSEFLAENSRSSIMEKKSTILSSRQPNGTLPSAEVTLCTEPNFKGECTNSTWPVNECISLEGYAGKTKSFKIVGEGFECLFMQKQCDAAVPYIEIGDLSSANPDAGKDLTKLQWLDKSSSYMCFQEMEEMKRFVKVAKLRAKMKVAAQ